MSDAPAGFADLGVPSDLCDALARTGITIPFPVQAAVIPDAMSGADVAGRAPTGSGKTLAFGLPLLTRLRDGHRRRPTALVLAPTRELAEQIAIELRPLARLRRHDVVSIYGGVSYAPQRKRLDAGAELVVACPGRLEDLIASGDVELDDVDQVVVDEADRMADMGFLPSVRRILALTSPDRQVQLFSATFDKAITALSRDVQRKPAVHEVGSAGPDISNATHLFWKVDRMERATVAAQAIAKLGSAIVFCRTRHGSDRLARQLERDGVSAAPLHGGLTQRKRDQALASFMSGDVAALVATDVAARGVHVDGVAGVIHFDPPEDALMYIHRSGRTARAGASGTVVSLLESASKVVRKMQQDLGLASGVTAVDIDVIETTEIVRKPRQVVERDDTRRGERPRRSERPQRQRDGGRREQSGRFERAGRPGAVGQVTRAGRRDDGAFRGDRDRPFDSNERRPNRADRRATEFAPAHNAEPRRNDDRRERRSGRPGFERLRGEVTFFHLTKGFGFIDQGTGTDLFVHQSNLARGQALPEGATVEFTVGPGKRGEEAFDVAVV